MNIRKCTQMLSFLWIMLLCVSCSHQNKIEKAINEAEKLRDSLTIYSDNILKTSQIDQQSNSKTLYAKCKKVATALPNDTLAAKALFNIAAIYKARKEANRSIGIWGLIKDHYSNTKYASEALFLQAFTLDNELQNKIMAKDYYELFIKTYPDHHLVKDATELLKLLNKADNEIIKPLKKQ